MTAISYPMAIPGLVLSRGAERSEACEDVRAFEDSPISLLPPDLRLRTELVSAFEEARVDNWDGHGARATSVDHLTSASRFLAALPVTWPLPDISVDPDGEFDFEWRTGARRVFSVSVGRDGTLSYAGLYGGSRVHGVEGLDSGFLGPILDNLRRVFAESDSAA